MRRVVRWVAGVLILVLVGGGGWFYWQQRAKAAAAQVRPRLLTEAVGRGPVQSLVSGTGPVASVNGVTVKANVQGTVSQLLAKDGDIVKSGQTVVELTNESLVASLNQAQIDYDKAKADLENVLNPDSTARRAQELKLESARLTLTQRQADVANLKVVSPCSCVVVGVSVATGDAVKNDAPLVSLFDDNHPSVVAQIPQTLAAYIRPGQPAQVTISGFGSNPGQVSLIGAGTAGAKDAAVPVTFTLPAWPGIRPGMQAQVGLTPDLNIALGYIEANGTVSTTDIKEVRSRVAADAVTRVAVAVGDHVERNDLLVEMQSDPLQVQLQQAVNEVAVQELDLKNLVEPLADPNGSVRQLQTKVMSADNTLRSRHTDVDDLTVEAPVGGTISALNLHIGDRITPGGALFRVADYTSMQVEISVDELDVAKVKPGLPATITLDALPGKKFTGKVLKVNPEGVFKNDIANFMVTVQFNETDGLMAGMNATVSVQVQGKTDVLRVPARAVQVNQGRAMVRVFKGENEQPELRPVEIGLRTSEWVEVIKGLNEGDRVVTTEVRQGGTQPAGGFGMFGGAGRPAGGIVPAGGGGGGGAVQIRRPEGGRQ